MKVKPKTEGLCKSGGTQGMRYLMYHNTLSAAGLLILHVKTEFFHYLCFFARFDNCLLLRFTIPYPQSYAISLSFISVSSLSDSKIYN